MIVYDDSTTLRFLPTDRWPEPNYEESIHLLIDVSRGKSATREYLDTLPEGWAISLLP